MSLGWVWFLSKNKHSRKSYCTCPPLYLSSTVIHILRTSTQVTTRLLMKIEKKKKRIHTCRIKRGGLPSSFTGTTVREDLSLIFTGGKIMLLVSNLWRQNPHFGRVDLRNIRGQREFCPNMNALIGVMKSRSRHHQCVFKGSDIRHQRHPEELKTPPESNIAMGFALCCTGRFLNNWNPANVLTPFYRCMISFQARRAFIRHPDS